MLCLQLHKLFLYLSGELWLLTEPLLLGDLQTPLSHDLVEQTPRAQQRSLRGVPLLLSRQHMRACKEETRHSIIKVRSLTSLMKAEPSPTDDLQLALGLGFVLLHCLPATESCGEPEWSAE